LRARIAADLYPQRASSVNGFRAHIWYSGRLRRDSNRNPAERPVIMKLLVSKLLVRGRAWLLRLTASLTRLPSLRTWRQRLGGLADGCDPLALQRCLASQMFAIEPTESQAYLADDHLAEVTGHEAVA
jgi:hypothetical protein